MKEIWKDVVGYEGIYEVSNIGRVRTHENKTTESALHGIRRWKQRILKQKCHNNRDFRVCLWKEKKSKDYLVHRLVAEAFIPNPDNKRTVNHIDGNPQNNCIENLEWASYGENNNHAFDNNLIQTSKGVVLEKQATKELLKFRSLTKASEYLGKNHGYLSRTLKNSSIAVSKNGERYNVYVRI